MPDPIHDTAATSDLFVRVSNEIGVLKARLVGPNFGQREGEVVSAAVLSGLDQTVSPVGHVVLDFSDIGFINSAGIGACVAMHKSAKAKGADIVLYALRDDLREVFRVTRLDKLFKIAPDAKKLAKIVKR